MRLSEHCYAVTGLAYLPPWAVNAGFVVGDGRTLVIDTGGSRLAAATVLGYAQAVRPGNSILAVNTEKHLDHMLGNCLFRDEGIDVYGHPGVNRSAADLEAEIAENNAVIPDAERRDLGEGGLLFSGTRVCNPNKPVVPPHTFDLGGIKVELISTPGHTATNLTVWAPSERVAYCGDCVVNQYFPNLQSGSAADWRLWLKSLETLQALGAAVLVPGHGHVLQGAGIAQEISRVRRILEDACAVR